MTTSEAPAFGALLRRYRQRLGLTQEELAERARISVRAVTDLERGARRAPRKDTISLLADALALAPWEHAAFAAAARLHLVHPLPPPDEEIDRGSLSPALQGEKPGGGASRVSAVTGPQAGPTANVLGDESENSRPPSTPVSHGGFLGALPSGPLVGRETELHRVRAALDAAATNQGRLVLLAGEPGVGKTRLAQEAMLLAGERGFRVLVGRCYEQYVSTPFFPIAEALTSAWSVSSPALRQAAPSRFGELGRMLPDLLSVPTLPQGSGSRPRMLRAVAGFLHALAEEGPLALLLDDLHWADSASLDLLAYLARALRGTQVLLLGAYRDVEVGRQHPLESTLTALTRDRVVELLTLRGLPPDGTAGLIRARFGVEEVSEELCGLVHERTEGNPFFIEEVLSALMEQGAIFRSGDGWDRKAAAEIAVPQSVRSVVGQRVGRLAPAAQEVLRLASVLGQEWELDLLLSTMGEDEGVVLDHLDAALTVKLLEERRVGRRERYAFAHALIGQVLYDEVPRHRLRRLHLRVGDVLERKQGERPEAWADLARHFLAAGDEARAARYALLAGDHAAGLYAHAEAVHHYEAALESREEARDEMGAALVRAKLGVELRIMGRYDGALAVLDRAAETWRATGDLESLGRVLAEIGKVHWVNGTPEVGVRRLQDMLRIIEAHEQSSAPTVVYESLASLLFASGHYTEYLTTIERTADLARASGNGRLAARAEFHRGNALQMLGRVEEALRVTEEAIPLLREPGDLVLLSGAFNNKAYIHVHRGEFADATHAQQQAAEGLERLGDPLWITFIAALQKEPLFFMGEWIQVRKNLERAVAMSRQLGESWGSAYVLGGLGMLCLAEGQWDEAARHLAEAGTLATRAGDKQALRWATGRLAELEILMGHPAAAQARLVPLLDRPGLEEFDVTVFLPVLAWAYLELGDLARAEHVIDQALRRTRAEKLRLILVEALRVRAMILVRQGQDAEAEHALHEGLTLAVPNTVMVMFGARPARGPDTGASDALSLCRGAPTPCLWAPARDAG